VPTLPDPLLVSVHQPVTNRMEPSGGSYEISYITDFRPAKSKLSTLILRSSDLTGSRDQNAFQVCPEPR